VKHGGAPTSKPRHGSLARNSASGSQGECELPFPVPILGASRFPRCAHDHEKRLLTTKLQEKLRMKNLVLGALLAVASVSTGCSSSDSGVTVDVSWKFTHLEDGTARACPTNFGTAVIKSQLINDSSHLGSGSDFSDLFNCSAMAGTIVLPTADQYLVWVEIQNDSGSSTYATSNSTFVDTTFATDPVDVEIIDDGGYFFFTWDLEDTTGKLLSCADAGVTSSGSVETIATSVATPSYFRNDKFTCEDHYGTTDPLLADTYTVSIDAEEGNAAIGTAPEKTNQEITAPNGLTDLGHIVITVDN